MTHIAPCHGCHLRPGCDQNKEFLSRLQGLAARSVKFKCPILDRELRPGRRIVMNTRFVFPEEGFSQVVRATILRVDVNYRFASIIEEDELDHCEWSAIKGIANNPSNVRFRKHKPNSRILEFLDEPDLTVCAQSQIVTDKVCGECRDWTECKFRDSLNQGSTP